MFTTNRKRYFVSRPRGIYCEDYGYYSRVYPTRNSNVLIFATNSAIKVEWLIYLGVTLDAPTERFRGYEYAVSVRRLVSVFTSRFLPNLKSEFRRISGVRYEAKDYAKMVLGRDYHTSHAERNRLVSEYIYGHRELMPISTPAIEFAMERFQNCDIFDEGFSNYLADPITEHIFPYDALNFDYLSDLQSGKYSRS